MEEKLYYVGIAATIGPVVAGSIAEESVCADVIIHVYVKTIDETYASVAASDICSDQGMVFRSFTYLPSEETELTLHPGEEHATAYRHAMQTGIAYVLASVFDGSHNRISMSQFS